jgi:hypothetical protein
VILRNPQLGISFLLTRRGIQLLILPLRIGPLNYLIEPHDDRARAMLARYLSELDCVPFSGDPHRIIHCLPFQPGASPQQYSPTLDAATSHLPWREGLGAGAERFHAIRQGTLKTGSDVLPHHLATLLPATLPLVGWNILPDGTGNLVWLHSRSKHSFWLLNRQADGLDGGYQVPWAVIGEDVMRMGGALMHAGMALRNGRSLLLTAPPGGGKTTSFSRLPRTWKVLADDAVLVWPDDDGVFWASPLPTWSVLLQVTQKLPAITSWQVSRSSRIGSVALLQQEASDALLALAPVDAVQFLYRSFVEHPSALPRRDMVQHHRFLAASRIAKAIPSWQMNVSLRGHFWQLLERHLDDW